MFSSLYISLLEDPKWHVNAMPLFTKEDFLNATKSDTSLSYKTTVRDLDTLSELGIDYEEILDQANEIYLLEEKYPFEQTKSNSFIFLDWISRLCNRNVTNAIKIRYQIFNELNLLQGNRSTDKPILWTAGCSFTAGEGVTHNQRYGHLLAEKLGMPEVSLSYRGSSVMWAADQILRSDIKLGDLVVWGLTDTTRVDLNNGFSLNSLPISGYIKDISKEDRFWNIDYFGSITQEVTVARSILQVINYCNKIGVKLILANLKNQTIIPLMLYNYENAIDLTTKKFLDLGTDNNHPGPEQHRHYATKIYNLIIGQDKRG